MDLELHLWLAQKPGHQLVFPVNHIIQTVSRIFISFTHQPHIWRERLQWGLHCAILLYKVYHVLIIVGTGPQHDWDQHGSIRALRHCLMANPAALRQSFRSLDPHPAVRE